MIINAKNILNALRNIINQRKDNDSEDDYLDNQVAELKKYFYADYTLPFRIIGRRSNGLIIKIGGLISYIPFSKMPWSYKSIVAWQNISNALIGKKFFCKIKSITKNPLKISLDTNIPQFKKLGFNVGGLYQSIIVNKFDYGIFVDLGYHYGWRAGSYVGLVHRNIINYLGYDFDDLLPGKIFNAVYWGIDKSNLLILGDEFRGYFVNKDNYRIGKLVTVRVIKGQDNVLEFRVGDKYRGVFNLSKYAKAEREEIKRSIKNLRNNSLIISQVVSINILKRVVELKWIPKWKSLNCTKGTKK